MPSNALANRNDTNSAKFSAERGFLWGRGESEVRGGAMCDGVLAPCHQNAQTPQRNDNCVDNHHCDQYIFDSLHIRAESIVVHKDVPIGQRTSLLVYVLIDSLKMMSTNSNTKNNRQ